MGATDGASTTAKKLRFQEKRKGRITMTLVAPLLSTLVLDLHSLLPLLIGTYIGKRRST